MFGLGIFEILVFILIGGGFILYLHPELATRDGYSGWLTPKRVGLATLRIVVWVIIVTLRAPKSSGPPTPEAARQTFGFMMGAALLTWVLFRLPRMWNGVRTKFVSH